MINENNILTKGYRGRIGNMIFRRWGEKTVVSLAPDTSHRKWSKAQKINRARFHNAMSWTRKELEDPAKRKYYHKKAKGMQTVWNVCVADYMKKPQIEEIDVRNYMGQKGNTIRVTAFDNYRVAAVIVAILNSQGFEVECGLAVEMSNGFDWIYKSMKTNPLWEGGRIVVSVKDSPGNTVKIFKELVLPKISFLIKNNGFFS